jgi:predicted transcriptional regulator
MQMSTSVIRALDILELLSKADRPMPLTPIAEQLGIPKSTAHTILRDLASREFLVISEHASYSIGLKAFEIGAAHLRSLNALDVVTPQLVELTHALGVTSHYAILDAADAVYLCKEEPPGLGIKLASSVGARLPARNWRRCAGRASVRTTAIQPPEFAASPPRYSTIPALPVPLASATCWDLHLNWTRPSPKLSGLQSERRRSWASEPSNELRDFAKGHS